MANKWVLCIPLFLFGCGSNVISLIEPPNNSGVDRNGVPLNSVLPTNFDPSKTYPWVIFDHGSDQFGASIVEGDPKIQSLATALSAAGYVVASSEYRVEDCWGNQSCVEDISALYDAFMEKMNLDPRPFVIGVSMGGIVTWNAVLHGDFVPRAVAGISPACNLANMYKTGLFTKTIDNDYGFTNPSKFSIATAGYDPIGSENLVPLTKFPIMMWASYGDTTVNRTMNADLLASSVNALGGSVTVITTTGNHGDSSNFPQPDAVVSFFNSAL
jgi:acetyl esterase/lipase